MDSVSQKQPLLIINSKCHSYSFLLIPIELASNCTHGINGQDVENKIRYGCH